MVDQPTSPGSNLIMRRRPANMTWSRSGESHSGNARKLDAKRACKTRGAEANAENLVKLIRQWRSLFLFPTTRKNELGPVDQYGLLRGVREDSELGRVGPG